MVSLYLTKKFARKEGAKLIEDKAIEMSNQYNIATVIIIGGDNKDESQRVLNDLKAKYPEKNIIFSEFGPVISSHLGLGGFGIGVVNRHIELY